jgi:hypothetical protein
MRSYYRLLVATVGLVMAVATSLHAQETITDVGRVQALIKRGDLVIVTDAMGRQTKSTVADPSAESLLRQLGLPTIDVREIAVERQDSIWNGALIGLAVAGTPWLITCAANDWCYYNEYGAENLLRTTAITTALAGAGIGALLDLSMRKRFTIYRVANGRPSTIGVTPAVSATGTSVRISARF